MKRYLVALAVVVASCGGAVEPTTTAAPSPDLASTVVADWLAALDEGRFSDAAGLAHERSSIIVVAAENQLGNQEIEQLVAAGLPPELADEYWHSFADEFLTFSAASLGSMSVGEAEVFVLDGRTFAGVELSSSGGGSETEILVTLDEGRWLIDPTATFGPSLTRLIESIVLGASPDSSTRDLFTEVGRSSL
ncbi:MAG: hypothetical protein KJO18_06870, partial [Acidimicrobiia bacterium]|nr:hypothetical protein [Acidimicrobiia bacterium]